MVSWSCRFRSAYRIERSSWVFSETNRGIEGKSAHMQEVAAVVRHRGTRGRGSGLEFTVLLNSQLDPGGIDAPSEQNVQLDRPSPPRQTRGGGRSSPSPAHCALNQDPPTSAWSSVRRPGRAGAQGPWRGARLRSRRVLGRRAGVWGRARACPSVRVGRFLRRGRWRAGPA